MARLLIDVMNVIGSRPDGWWNDPDRAMRNFAVALDRYAEGSDDELTAVFDKDPGSLPNVDHIKVVFARRKGRNAADYEIEQIVSGAEEPSQLTVVTSDKRLRETVRSLGADVIPSGVFRRRLDPEPGARGAL